MDSLPTVLLKPGEADRVVAGHPWVYQSSILRLTQPAGDGELVQVKDHRQRFLGVGFYNSRSKINVRVLSPERVEVNQSFFEQRIGAAELVLREKQTQLEDPAIASDASRLLVVHEEMEAVRKELDALYARWAELEEKQG